MAKYTVPLTLDQSQLAYGGYWKVEPQRIVAGKDATLRLHFFARKVHLVMTGTGFIDVLLDGKVVHEQKHVRAFQPMPVVKVQLGSAKSLEL